MTSDIDYQGEMAALDAITPATHSARDATHFRRIIAARAALAAAGGRPARGGARRP